VLLTVLPYVNWVEADKDKMAYGSAAVATITAHPYPANYPMYDLKWQYQYRQTTDEPWQTPADYSYATGESVEMTAWWYPGYYMWRAVNGDRALEKADEWGLWKYSQAINILKVDLSVENNLTECMEGRSVTFTATASSGFPCGTFNAIDFTFYFKHPDGTAWSDTDWSWDLVEDHSENAEDVLNGDADHKYNWPVYVKASNDGYTCTSDTLNIAVYELWIEYFRHDSSHEWKVVVGKPIQFKAIASTDCTNWKWDMQDGFPDTWNPEGGNARAAATMVIPNSDLPSDSHWNYFGDTYGTVDVFCEDGEGNNHHFYSTTDGGKKAKVFFDRTATTHPGGVSPNWYYYWSAAMGVTTQHSYDGSLATSDTTVTSATTWTIRIGSNADWPGGNPPTGGTYINGFWATNLHEFWHRDHRVHNFSTHGGWSPPAADDVDGDGICDREPTDPPGIHTGGWEATIGTDPNVPNSTEDGGNWAESQGTYGHDAKDWAAPGSQW